MAFDGTQVTRVCLPVSQFSGFEHFIRCASPLSDQSWCLLFLTIFILENFCKYSPPSKVYVRMCVCMLSCIRRIRLFSTLCTVARQVPRCMGLLRQEDWSELPCPPPRDLPDPGSIPHLLCLLHW